MIRKYIKKLDLIWAKLVKDKAGWVCEHCGIKGTRMEAAHVVGRRHRATRWGAFVNKGWVEYKNKTARGLFQDIEYDLCGHCFCHSCHQHYDEHGPLEQDIVNDTIGKERKERLQSFATQTIAKYQVFEEVKSLLEKIREEFKLGRSYERLLHTED